MLKTIAFKHLSTFNLYSCIQASRLSYRKTINHFFDQNPTYIPTIRELDSIKLLSKPNALEIIANHCLKHIKDPRLFIDYINYLESNSILYNRPQLNQEKIATLIESPAIPFNPKAAVLGVFKSRLPNSDLKLSSLYSNSKKY